jgi:transposase
MFMREKESGKYKYLQVVHNRRVEGKVKQDVIATLGRVDVLQKSGQIDGLLASGSRFASKVAVLDAHRRGKMPAAESKRIGASVVFERLWKESGVPKVIKHLLRERKYGFDVERGVFLTVLHRLFDPGSDRAAEVWRRRYKITGVERLGLHHLYRTMAWLGERLCEEGRERGNVLSPRCTKDLIEEWLFESRRDLFSSLDIVFFDTTTIYFEGDGGETIGRYGNSKDKRPDLKQMVVGVVLEESGRPLCCELWPGNTTDVKTLIPVVDRLRSRFHIGSLCVVADRGMVSAEVIERLKERHRNTRFILGARMRAVAEVRDEVLSRGGEYQVVYGPRKDRHDPTPLKVKEVFVEDRRYVVCHNDEEAEKDRADREAIVASLQDRLKRGDKSLVGNKGYRKFLKTLEGPRFDIDEDKVVQEAQFDGKWVLRTDAELPAEKVALKYKELWMVEAAFRSVKSVLETRPIYHKLDETIRGHVFCSFLALMLLKQLQQKMEARGWRLEWERVRHDLDELQEFTVRNPGKTFLIRSQTLGDVGKALQAVGVAVGPTVRLLEGENA